MKQRRDAHVIRVSATWMEDAANTLPALPVISIASDMDRMYNKARSFFKIGKGDTNRSTRQGFGVDEFLSPFIPWEDGAGKRNWTAKQKSTGGARSQSRFHTDRHA